MTDFVAAIKALGTLVESTPLAIRAVRLFSEKVIAGESVPTALTKTAEIIAAELLLG